MEQDGFGEGGLSTSVDAQELPIREQVLGPTPEESYSGILATS